MNEFASLGNDLYDLNREIDTPIAVLSLALREKIPFNHTLLWGAIGQLFVSHGFCVINGEMKQAIRIIALINKIKDLFAFSTGLMSR